MSYSNIEKLISSTIDLEQDLNDLIEGVSNDFISCPNNKEEIFQISSSKKKNYLS